MLIIWLAGCIFELDEDAFKEQFSYGICQRLSECQRGYYENEYDGDLEDCADDVDDGLDDIDGGDFDEDQAADCMEEVRSISCGDLYEDGLEDCEEVWD